MESALAIKLKESINIRVFVQNDNGWTKVPARVADGEAELDLRGFGKDARFHLELNMAERFREIVAGSIMVGGSWKPIHHDVGLDTKWSMSFVGNFLLKEIRFSTQDGEDISIPVRYIGEEKKEEQKETLRLPVAVRTDYQLVNVMWQAMDCAAYDVTVFAVEGAAKYMVSTVRVPSSQQYLCIDKLAHGAYYVRVSALDEANAVLVLSDKVRFEIPRR